jgi:hypothetical protein
MARVEDIPENVDICLRVCGTCFTYPGIIGETLFYARGKSSAPKKKNGCNCPQCDVQKKYDCDGSYYCIEGPCE